MVAKILYGAPVKEKIKKELIERVKKLDKRLVLAIVQVGDRADSNAYVKNKIKFGEEIGVRTMIEKLKIEGLKDSGEKELIKKIKELNENKDVNGIIVQLPLPEGFDTEKILNTIDIKKDADGLVSRTLLDKVPATARGVMSLLDFYQIPVSGKKVAVIGRSKLAGSPIAELLQKNGAEVVVCNRSTENMAQVCKGSDILISAAGKIGLVNKGFVNTKQVIVDVGINKNAEGKLVGDVDFEEVSLIVAAITPVPGGVGPLTVVSLFQNLLDLTSQNH